MDTPQPPPGSLPRPADEDPGHGEDPTPRTTARVVPVADDGRCLLLLERDPAHPDQHYWGTVGGAVDPGEDLVAAAVRELAEETGIRVDPDRLTGPVDQRRTRYSWNGTPYAGQATCFALRLDPATPVSFDALEAEEVGNVLEARWLTPDEARADGRLMWPDLADVMERAAVAVAEAIS